MSAALGLTGFRDSVYTRTVRIALAARDLPCAYTEANPFSADGQAALRGLHPFGRVPVLTHGRFRLYETRAILGYLEDTFGGPDLMPQDPHMRARARQVMGIADNYAYTALVRQVFSHGLYRPHVGEPADRAQLDAGLAAAPAILDALEAIAAEGLAAPGRMLGAADCLLFPMMDYLALVPQGRAMLSTRPRLSTWLGDMSARSPCVATRPDFATRLEALT